MTDTHQRCRFGERSDNQCPMRAMYHTDRAYVQRIADLRMPGSRWMKTMLEWRCCAAHRVDQHDVPMV